MASFLPATRWGRSVERNVAFESSVKATTRFSGGLFAKAVIGDDVGGLVDMTEVVFGIDNLDDAPQLFGLLGGYGLSHGLSPMIYAYACSLIVAITWDARAAVQYDARRAGCGVAV